MAAFVTPADITARQHVAPVEPSQQTALDLEQYARAADVFSHCTTPLEAKVDAFTRFCSRPSLSRFISRYEVFKRILNVNGSIVECGVFHGAGLFSFAKISSILEPTNHSRHIIGFDTFTGFPGIDEKDRKGGADVAHTGAFRGSSAADIAASVDLFDFNRPLSHLQKVEIVAGDICKTAPAYVAANPHLVVSLLNLDLDLYEPTKAALTAFLPVMPKGAIIIFDELNAAKVPGETIAVKELIGISNLRIERFSHDTYFSFAVIE